MIKKRVSEKEANPAEWEQRLKTEVEERTREKFTLPVGPWTPVDRARLPKLPGIDADQSPDFPGNGEVSGHAGLAGDQDR